MKRWHFSAAGFILLFLLIGLTQKGLAEERYTVKEGDSLYKISKTFGVSIEALKKMNGLERDHLKLKQVLLIPASKEVERGGSTERVSGKAARKASSEEESYIVRNGDNLWNISGRVGLSIEEIKKLNHLQGTTLKVGQVLTLPKTGRVEEVDEVDEPGDSKEPVVEPSAANEQEETPHEPVGKWSSSEERNLFVRVAKTFLGVPYRLGGSTLKGIDCSAFVKRIYQIFSVDLPRTAREQFHFGKGVEKEELEEGDLVFFRTRRANGTHVGIYIGNNQFVHASSVKREVKIDSLDTPYYNKRFLRGVRVKEFEQEI